MVKHSSFNEKVIAVAIWKLYTCFAILWYDFVWLLVNVNPLSLSPANGQTHSNNPSAILDEIFKCVLPFCGVGV